MSKNNYIRRQNKTVYGFRFYFDCKLCTFACDRKDEFKQHHENKHPKRQPK